MTEQRYLNFLNADDCALLMIDHQTGTMLGVQDIRLDQFRSNVLALAGLGWESPQSADRVHGELC